MITNQRILWDDDGTETDLSIALNDFRTGSQVIDFVAADDKLYVASDMPFNHKWIEASVVNDAASVVTVENWFGGSDGWVSAVDIIDRTSVGGVSLAQSGVIQWKTNREKGWNRELDSEDVTGITVTGLYDMYWLRFGWSADWNALTALSFVGQKFSSDDVLYSRYPDLNNANLKTSYESGKTDWDEQHFMAAEIIIGDLKSRNIIFSASQILDFELFADAASHKVAEIIYKALGRSWEDQRQVARKYYDESMNKNFYNIDHNRNANLDDCERATSTGVLSR